MTMPAAPRPPLEAYRARLADGDLAPDPAQRLAVERLQALWLRLRGYDPPAAGASLGLLGRLLGRRAAPSLLGEWAPEERPNGLYIVGSVGRGKSMLMDLFFAAAEVSRKRRVHFHRFMQDAHRRVHRWRAENGAHDPGGDPVPPLADAIAAEAALLCFDEFQINDIADAMLLGRLMEALFARGVVVVATSNTRPDDLFRGKPGRDAFLPYVKLLKSRLDLLVLDGARDYRRERLRDRGVWHVPADAAARAALDDAFLLLAAGVAAGPARLTVSGRTLAIPEAAPGVARFGFSELCGTALGAGDYLALATHYPALVLDGVPVLGPEERDAARRLITLVDALYDHRCKLVASAEAEPDALYVAGDGAEAFARTASRLEEMRSAGYLALPHLT